MSTPRILIAGIGNIFLGDDAFGVEVVRRLAQRSLPDEVRVVDFGIRGFDLACAVLENYELVVLVDIAPRGAAPGTVYLIEPEMPTPAEIAASGVAVEMHNLTPERVLRMAASFGSIRARVLVVGCEPLQFQSENDADADTDGPDAMAFGLSPPVQAAIDRAISIIESLVTQTLGSSTIGDRSLAGIYLGRQPNESQI
ncbi:MAG TPA: hydrogenase maturation protease [Pirellulales bacterium]|nr:hydrogenase maturation protease [Pirellulales bacterium]